MQNPQFNYLRVAVALEDSKSVEYISRYNNKQV